VTNMKIEAGKTYKTRGGKDAFVYCVDAPGEYPIHGRVDNLFRCWTANGKWINHVEDDNDLMPPAPPRISQTVWVNVHKDGLIIYTSKSHANLTDPVFTIRHAVPCRLEEIVE